MILEPHTIYIAVFGSSLVINFGKGEISGCYYCDLVYSFVSGKHTTKNNYWYGYVGVTVYYFYMWNM